MSKITKIWASACWHTGAKTCHLSLLEKQVEQALKNKWNTIILGDILDCGISAGSKHVGLEYQNAMNPMDQIEKAIEIAAPLAKAKLIKGIWQGNHGYRAVKAVGISPEKFIAMALSLISEPNKKPSAVLPSLIQRVHEVFELSKGSFGGGRGPMECALAKEKLTQELAKVRPGPEDEWAIPFHPGIGHIEIDNIPIIAHHGTHNKSTQNWMKLERADKGFRLYFTSHNHSLDAHTDYDIYMGKKKPVDYYSVGCFQGYEQYAQVACYPPRPTGSVLVTFDHDKNKAQCEFLTD